MKNPIDTICSKLSALQWKKQVIAVCVAVIVVMALGAAIA